MAYRPSGCRLVTLMRSSARSAHSRPNRTEDCWSRRPTFTNIQLIFQLAARYRIPAIYPTRGFAAEGGLMSYGPDSADLFRNAATYVDRILRGEKPSELPVQFPTRFDLVVNLKAARAIGLEIPRALIARAAEVIE